MAGQISFPHPQFEAVVIRFVIPVVFINCLEWSVCTCLTQLVFNGRGIYSIYYIRYNYMFRCLTMAIFRLYMKYLVSGYTRLTWAVYSGEVGVEVGMRYHMCHRGWEVWVHGGTLLLFVLSKLI